MFKELITNKEKYFWTRNKPGQILMGGTDRGRFYGMMDCTINKDTACIKRTASNGVSSSMLLADMNFSNGSLEYNEIKNLITEIEKYLALKETSAYQEINRAKLLQNVMNFLPEYRG